MLHRQSGEVGALRTGSVGAGLEDEGAHLREKKGEARTQPAHTCPHLSPWAHTCLCLPVPATLAFSAAWKACVLTSLSASSQS